MDQFPFTLIGGPADGTQGQTYGAKILRVPVLDESGMRMEAYERLGTTQDGGLLFGYVKPDER